MSLLRSAWRVLVGIKDVLALMALLVFFGALYAAISARPDPGTLRGGALLVQLDGVLVERKTEAALLDMLSGSVPTGETRARDLVRALRLAAKDDEIKAVVLDLDRFLGGGAVSIADVTRAMDEVRRAKKPILTFATGYSDDSYALAAHASEVWLDPIGGVLIAGPGGTQPYFKGLLDRYGVNVHVYRVGKYKSFVEPYTRADQSPEAKADSEALATALWDEWRAGVKAGRPKAQIDRFASDPAGSIAAADGDLAKAAMAQGLVDKLGTETAFGTRVAALVGGEPDDEGPGDFNHDAMAAYLKANAESGSGDPVAIIEVSGDIVDGPGGSESAGGDTIADNIHAAITEQNARAIVLRVNSPGGSVMASEKIRLALLDAKAKNLPIIVSMVNVAASGGYWIATAGDRIYAEPATITGSIGVFGIIPTFEKTLAQYGVTTDGVKTTPLSGQPDILGGTNATGDQVIQASIDSIYRRFTGLVASARKLPLAKVEEIAQGRVWAGGPARQLGLVDAFGSLDDAVAEAAKRAGIEPDNVRRVYPTGQSSFVSRLVADVAEEGRVRAAPLGLADRMVRIQQGQMMAHLTRASRLAQGSALQAHCFGCPALPAVQPLPRNWFNRMFD